MSDLIQKLTDAGADTSRALRRFLNDTELYEACFADFLADENFAGLHAALAEKDYNNAYTCAHTLKGVAGNMGLTPIYDAVCKLLAALRAEDFPALDALQAEVQHQYDTLRQMV